MTGDGTPENNAALYTQAFPDAAANMGCPAACVGYELVADLDFDEDGDGGTHTAGAGDAEDETYYNGGAGWMPLGGLSNSPTDYTAIFEGNGHTISNLFINNTGSAGGFIGLFARVTGGGAIRNVGIVDPYVRNHTTDSGHVRSSALAGHLDGATISGSYVSGGSVRGTNAGTKWTGCLAGFVWSASNVNDSWASCAVTQGAGSAGAVGGLVGGAQSGNTVVRDSYATGRVSGGNFRTGGLAGMVASDAQVYRSYATGDVSGSGGDPAAVGGLVGYVGTGGDIFDSYATGNVTGSAHFTGGLVGDLSGTSASVNGSYAIGNVTSSGARVGGLVGDVSTSGRVSTSYATGAVSGSGADVGGLVGRITSNNAYITASYATGNVTATGGSNNIGGLIGYLTRTPDVTASYATGNVSSSSDGNDNMGGLIGYTEVGSSQIADVDYCYAIGELSNTGMGSDNLGGLIGRINDNVNPPGDVGTGNLTNIFTNTYWDSQATGQASYAGNQGSRNRGGTVQTTSALQTPTAFTGTIYANWPQAHWELGTGSQYPTLKSLNAAGIAWQAARHATPPTAPVDYDRDNDGLIEVGSLAQLDAIRHDPNGDGNSVAGVRGVAYLAAFPGLGLEYDNDDNDGLMGCPGGICHGYELTADLDFASDDAYADWTPIGAYSGVFAGQGHSIANLTITSATGNVGLFEAVTGSNGLLDGVRLPNVNIAVASPNTVGALAGKVENGAMVRTSYASGTIAASVTGSNEIHAGGLVGRTANDTHIAASYAQVGVAVTADDPAAAPHTGAGVGGLVGVAEGAAGRQVVITAAYATGAVSANWTAANPPVGGLYGDDSVTRASASYWDTATTGIADDADDDPPEGKSSAELRSPTDYAGIYATWDDYDLNGDGETDAPWDFGSRGQYPTLDPDPYGLEPEPEPEPDTDTDDPGEYVAPPIVYNLNIRFSVKGLTLDEGESATYQVRMTQAPAGHPAKVRIHSNNPDVVVSPTVLTFSSADYNQWQTVSVTTLRDPNNTDESAHLAHRGPNLSYGSIIVAVNDIWPGTHTETVNGHTVTLRYALDAPAGVTVTAPATLDADTEVTIGAAPSDTPLSAPGYGLGATAAARLLASIRVDAAPSDGLTVCLEAPADLVAEAGERTLTLLRYANRGWSPVAGAARRDDAGGGGATGTATLCADGVRQYGVFAAAYTIPDALGLAANLAAASGGAGRIVLTWTPAANATVHFVFGIKKSDAAARDFSNLAAWGFAERLNVHTVTGLESGVTYYFTVIGGRARANGSDEWGAWTPLLTATAE